MTKVAIHRRIKFYKTLIEKKQNTPKSKKYQYLVLDAEN